ncbi:MAG: ABC transporter permease [Propionibacteriaceae bacterium]|jgi:NitT/TauT family transport system permease protein|nr:ABC transporter permease [Propionibacteriaceae bacterium]
MKRTLAAPVLLACVLVFGWAAFTWATGVPQIVLPSPSAVWDRLVTSVSSGLIAPYLGVTLAEALGGCVLGAAVALPLAVLIHRSKWVSDAVNPFLGATQAIPAVALAPLLAMWAGYGWSSIVLLCGLMVFFPILISTVVGLRHVPAPIVEAARLDGAGSLQLLLNIEVPLALHTMLAGLRNGFTLSITGAVVGEMVIGGGATLGLGSLLTVQRDATNTAGMFATIIVLCVVAATLYSLIQLWERRSRIIESTR